jgi:general secretion pathway protein L
LNLLQGTFRPRTGWQERLRPWRWAAVLLAALAVVGVLGEVQHLRHLRAEERRLDEQIAADWARIAPGELVPKDLRGRLLQRAELLGQQQAARRGLLPVLSAVASGLAGGGTLKGLSYREGQLEMSVSVADAAALDRLGTQLGQSGYTVDILSDSQEKERYLARMRVQGEGP